MLLVIPFYELLLTHSQWLRVRVGFVFLISFQGIKLSEYI